MPDLDFRDRNDPAFWSEDNPGPVAPSSQPLGPVQPQQLGPVGGGDADSQFQAYEHYADAQQPPATGLDSYEVVPDDFEGELGPNQIRQSQRDELDHYNFGDFNVVPDDFVGPLTTDQMRQSDYQSMQQAWLNISSGQGMNISGSDEDQEAFRMMLREGMTDSPTFRNMMTSIGNDDDPAHTIQANVGRNQPGVIGDSFATNDVDISDLEAFPSAPSEDHPNQVTRNELMVHFLTERQNALASANPNDFNPAHSHGIDMQNQYRAERDQAAVLSQTGKMNPDGTITATVAMEGGDSETWDIDNTQAITGTTPP